jgi:hypothetical protein
MGSKKVSFKNQDIITIDISNENHADLMNILKTLESYSQERKNINDCITRLISWWYKGENP